MMQILKDTGYKGTIGIIGHMEGADARPVLQADLAGFEDLKKQIKIFRYE